MDKEKTGRFIKEQREKCGLTQSELAEKLITSRENISKWERGLAIPNTEYLKALCEILNCNVVDLLSAGERNRAADKIIYELMDKYVIFVKRVCYVAVTVVFLLLIAFLTHYFVNNYNSVKLYSVSGEKDGYKVLKSLIFVNKEKCFFTFGGFTTPEDDEIKKITIYYDDIDNQNNVIYSSDKIPTLVIFGLKEYDWDKIENDLKVQMITKNKVIYFDLIVEITYKNNHLLKEENNYINSIDYQKASDLPSYIDDKFIYDAKTDSYVYAYTENNTDVTIKYDYANKKLSIAEITKNLETRIETLGINKDIWFIDPYFNEYFYDVSKKECINNECTSDELAMIESYIKKYNQYLN